MRRAILFCIIWGIALSTYGQGETSNWYFGERAGIRFNPDGSVTALEDGRISTFEGCATISDTFGDLLFYTDGRTVYDRNHAIMQNGSGLYGDISSTQSAIIVPDPGNPDRYYIFTVDTKVFEEDPDFGLNYSVVDMSLNLGNGAVIEKNRNLLADCSEKITAVIKDCNDQSYWLLTLATPDGSPGLLNTFHAFEINTGGVVTTSVTTTFDDIALPDPRGYLKLSPDGTKVACANASSGLYLYDFDAATGLLTNQTFIEIEGENRYPYGVEFSPSGELLYVHASNDLPEQSGHTSSLFQFNLSAADIANSAVVLHSGNDYRGALQLGANGKIFRTIAQDYTQGTPYLGVINNPDDPGVAAGYEHEAVFLGSRRATQGLPPFVQSFFNTTAIIRNADGTTSKSLEICEGEGFLLQTDSIPGAIYEWEKDDIPLGISGPILQINNATLDASGRYEVTITKPDPNECPVKGDAFIKVNPLPLAPDLMLTQCDVGPENSVDGISFFNLENSIEDPALEYSFYETIADRDNDIPIAMTTEFQNTVPFNQTLYYRVINEFDCHTDGILELEVRSNPFAAQSDFTLYSCDEDPNDAELLSTFDLGSFATQEYSDVQVTFYSDLNDVALKTNPLPDAYITATSTIYARLDLLNECIGVDKIDLNVLPSPQIALEEEYLLCTDNPQLQITAPAGFDYYRWELLDGVQASVLTEESILGVEVIGRYRLTVGYIYDLPSESINCEESWDFRVIPSNRATFEDFIIEDFSDDNRVEILVSGDGDYEYSLDGITYQSDELFRNLAPGFYTAYVRDRNGCGISTEDISILGYPKFFTPNGDGINDYWKLIGADEQFQPDTSVSIFDRYGRLLAQISPLNEGWNGNFNANPLPASDYWFRIKLSDGREITGHFALKR